MNRTNQTAKCDYCGRSATNAGPAAFDVPGWTWFTFGPAGPTKHGCPTCAPKLESEYVAYMEAWRRGVDEKRRETKT